MKGSPQLFVVGAGGHAREVHSYLTDLKNSGWQGTLRGFLDDHLPPGLSGRLDVLGTLATVERPPSAAYHLAVGSNSARKALAERADSLFGHSSAWTLVHPDARVGEDIEIGQGSCLAPAVVVTASTRIGRHCILNVKSSVSHDCVVDDFVNINPGATVCGWVNIGEGAFIGAGATVKDRVSIGAWSVIGAGAVVTRDIPANCTAVGVPARIIKRRN